MLKKQKASQTLNNKTFQRATWFFVFLVVWELFARFGNINPLILPPLTNIFFAMINGFIEGDLLLQLLQSVALVVFGLLTGLLIALILSYAGYLNTWLCSMSDLLSSMLHPLPGIALLPIVILWVGVGLPAVFIIIIHAVIWTLYLNLMLGFRLVEPELIEVAKNYGATKTQIFWHVLLPCSKEAIKTGLQVAWSRGWRALISAEMLFGAMSAIGGIGWYIYEKRAFMNTEGVYAGILVVIFVGVFVENVVFKNKNEKLYQVK